MAVVRVMILHQVAAVHALGTFDGCDLRTLFKPTIVHIRLSNGLW